jgi:hypothetical protein
MKSTFPSVSFTPLMLTFRSRAISFILAASGVFPLSTSGGKDAMTSLSLFRLIVSSVGPRQLQRG